MDGFKILSQIPMDLLNCKHLRLFLGTHLNSVTCRCVTLLLVIIALLTTTFSGFAGLEHGNIIAIHNHSLSFNMEFGIRKPVKYLEVPQLVWGLNNQKIAFARACLTARMLNRALLMPSLSASLFYKEIDLLQPISFGNVFQFKRFNWNCKGFVQLGRYSNLSNHTDVLELQKGSGRKWTVERDLDQLRQFNKDPYDKYEIIRIVGKNPFLWNDHWPIKDYAKVLECLVLVDEISKEADKVVSIIREKGTEIVSERVPYYVAVHMRMEKDWMIHCKKLDQRLNISEICSRKEEITRGVGNIEGLKTPMVVYLAVADSLLEDDSNLNGWKNGLIPFEKKKLGVVGIYKRYPYLLRSAIDYEVCLRLMFLLRTVFPHFQVL
ncbi:hypothetical protein ACSBR2_013812 [Camellia fascicularis]